MVKFAKDESGYVTSRYTPLIPAPVSSTVHVIFTLAPDIWVGGTTATLLIRGAELSTI